MSVKSNDHDLLIELKTNMAEVRKDIKNLSDNLVGRVAALEETRASKLEVEKALTATMQAVREETELKLKLHEAEIARLTKIVYGACGVILLGFMAQLVALAYK